MTEAPESTQQAAVHVRGRQPLGWLWLPAAILLLSGLIAFVAHNIGSRYFWTDESSTFLTSLSWPAPGDSPGDWGTMWAATMKAFLDPGLFHISSRLIAINIGTSIEVLRTFPLFFFGVYVVALLMLFRFVGAPWVLAFGGMSLMMLENITPYYALEFRPYSASLAASVALPLLALWILRRPRIWLALIAVAIFSFLALMQYMVGAAAVGAAAALVLGSRGRFPTKDRVLALSTAAYFVLFLPIVYAITRGGQFGDSTDSVRYTGDTVLRNQSWSEILNTLSVNFLSLTALPRTVFLIVVPVLWWTSRRASEGVLERRPGRWVLLLWTYVVVGTVSSAALSVVGVLPWVVGTRWSITEVGFIAVSVVGLAGLLAQWSIFYRRAVYASVAVASVLVAGIAGARLWSYERAQNVDYLTYLAPKLVSGVPGRTVVDYWIYPDVRYWLEYSGRYPDIRQKWIALNGRMSPDYVAAGPADIERFLSSDDDRLLLASSWPLKEYGRPLPETVRVISIPLDALDGMKQADSPVLLVKE